MVLQGVTIFCPAAVVISFNDTDSMLRSAKSRCAAATNRSRVCAERLACLLPWLTGIAAFLVVIVRSHCTRSSLSLVMSVNSDRLF